MTDNQSAEEQAAIERIRRQFAEQRRMRAIETALEWAGQRAADALRAREAAIAEIGELLRLARAGQPGGLPMTRAQELAGLSRPTLTEARDNPAPWEELTALARRAAAGDDEAVADLHARLPHLAGWRAATDRLQERFMREWEERGGFDATRSVLDIPDAPGRQELMASYEERVGRIAAGKPIDLVPAAEDRDD